MTQKRLYSLDKLRRTIGELDANDDVTNVRLRESGEYAQASFIQKMSNIGKRDPLLDPTINPTEIEFELVNSGAVAWFYYLENGIKDMFDQYEEAINRYIKDKFGRPNFNARRPL